ncbi:hypothetical protein BZB76_5787 [Actinomadura pelletieri DSM 43383]|uniref:Uncharacterized protein n=1 Tax=Actinomadura pelletieri DSM 43383 TaxID=1120940 RepID=A0A495QAH4_9ACTN|nr:hypothetical protein [Actinomadura pelletieri]RKS68665.1 hypothetical protein BZB76_5787 [Actinomadura pelletieri DSM 43383]
MIDWARLHGMYGPAHDVPALLQAAETGADDAWEGLWARLWHQETTCDAGIAALPTLASLSRHTNRAVRLPAVELAGAIFGAGLREGRPLKETEELRRPVAMLSASADQCLSERPADYRTYFRAKLALDGFPVLSDMLDDFLDFCCDVPCPQCSDKVSIVIGDYGCYSSIRDWNLGDVHPIPLRPASPNDLRHVQQHLHHAAVRDARPRLARGLTHVFGDATCGTCDAVFSVISALETRPTPFGESAEEAAGA